MILSSLIFFPILGMIIVMLLPKDKHDLIRYFSVGISLIPMAISIGFGILFATLIILVFVPSLYVAIDDMVKVFSAKKTDENRTQTG